MSIVELMILSIGLAMDAFAVAVCKGISMKNMDWKKAAIIGLYFGGFQALMPAIGYFLGTTFEHLVTSIDHWIAFVLLVFIGSNMIKEAFGDDDGNEDDSFSVKTMSVLAVATSIDALTIGIMFGLLPDVSILSAVTLIGVTTFVLSAIGLKVGNVFGLKYKKKAEIAGGTILILIGVKVLAEHLGFI